MQVNIYASNKKSKLTLAMISEILHFLAEIRIKINALEIGHAYVTKYQK